MIYALFTTCTLHMHTRIELFKSWCIYNYCKHHHIWSYLVFDTLLLVGEEYCLTETFHAECASHELIVMERAQFGRMRLGRCVTRNYGNIGCASNVLGLLDYACSGRWSCDVSVSDPALVRTKPCPKDFASYLEATYKCVPGSLM